MITSDQIAVIDRSHGFNITTHKTHFEMVMHHINTGCYGDGYGGEAHKTALDHFQRQIAATRLNIDAQEAKEAEEERKAEERKNGPQIDFESWWLQLIALKDAGEESPEFFTEPVEWKNDYWREGYTPEDALETFMQQTG